jgi:hypothetical protein
VTPPTELLMADEWEIRRDPRVLSTIIHPNGSRMVCGDTTMIGVLTRNVIAMHDRTRAGDDRESTGGTRDTPTSGSSPRRGRPSRESTDGGVASPRGRKLGLRTYQEPF